MQGNTDPGIIPFIWVSGSIVLGLALCLVLFFLLYQRRLLHAQEKLRRVELEQQLRMMQAVIEGQEIERKRLARELHDGVGVLLSTIRMRVLTLGKQQRLPEESTTTVRNLVDEALENVRAVSRDLMPPTLERLGLADALEALLERAAQTFGVTIDRKLDLPQRLGAEMEIHLFRIVQELLHNALRHGKPGHITCAVRAEHAQLRLSFADDGLGFDRHQGQPKGLGLQNLDSRLLMMQGSYTLDTAPGSGTRYDVRVPLPQVDPEAHFQ